MEDLIHRLLQEKVLTHSLIQEVFISAKKLQTTNIETWDKISQVLWQHLQTGALKIDDQLLCATCLYTVLSLTGREEFYLNQIIQIIQEELGQRKNDVILNSKTTLVVSLMYGIFQSSFLTTVTRHDQATITSLLESTVHLLIELAYDYSRNTFIVFKVISSLKKVCGTQWEKSVFTKKNQIKLLNLVNHNWESPITGVRDLNKVIFQTLLNLMDDVTYQATLREINGFYWNKAKYLMLSELISQRHNINIYELVNQNGWLNGLSNSLYKPGLVSAGTDMYFAILKQLLSEDDWIKMFLPIITEILNGESTKAIENFNNYWCLTTFKKFPTLIIVFENLFQNTVDLERKLYNGLLILKQGNKLGIISRNWNPSGDYEFLETIVLLGIDHEDVSIRMAAFDIVCEFHGKTMPTEKEYGLVLNYIKNNINSDCTVLRLNMLSSLKNYLTQIHSAYITHYKTGEVLDNQSLRTFLKTLQEHVIFNLNVKGNYQRKITSVKICSIVWECLNDIPKNKKMQTRFSETTLLKLLTENKEWLLLDDVFVTKLISFLQDPSDDIRENIVNLLLNYYSSVFKRPVFIDHVIAEALKCIGGKFFYEISCGQSMFKLIVNILIKENLEHATFKTVEDIYAFACRELIHEHDSKRDILESIEKGKQLHSFMDILLVVLDVCHRKSYKIEISAKEMRDLLKCLEDIANQFAWEESASSSDFSKMNDMVEHIIDNSGLTLKEDGDNTKISGVHQMVLNCIWLNVKACCDLASLMIRHCDHVTFIENCLLIITQALESSRHKGAIESAGAALGQAIQYLTSLPDEAEISKIPHDLLKFKLKELITEASRMASITRRGAGLSIMVHRIVSSDMKKGKPLFHYFMNMILATCNHSEDLPEDLKDMTDVDNEKDLPKAIYIHFLTRIVIDSSIASDVMFYSPQLAKLAFDNLTSSHWQIRNAALQLYGALVPKLLGQKKASGFGEDTIATVACDEIRTHSPKLWIHINRELKNANDSDKVGSHSVLIPLLNMLANSAMRYNFSSDPTESSLSNTILLQSLICLLNSPIFTVRRLTAKSIFNIYSIDSIYQTLMEHEFRSENFLHGVLMLMANCYKFYGNGLLSSKFDEIRQIIHDKLLVGRHSYLCKELYEDTFMQLQSDKIVEIVHDTLFELESKIHEPGIFNWANARIKNCIQHSSWNEIPKIIEMIIKRKEFESYCEILVERLKCNKQNISKDNLRQISELLLACENKFLSGAIWRVLFEISQITEISCSVHVLMNAMETDINMYNLRYMLPFIARILSTNIDENNVSRLSNLILSLCDPETVDVEMRYIAALTNNELSLTFHTLPDAVKVDTIKSTVILLQDEDEDVRNLSSVFCKNACLTQILYHPHICLHKILNSEFLNHVFREPRHSINILRTDIFSMLSKTTSQSLGENYNPFANVSRNIYMEVEILQEIVVALPQNIE